jgi:hypothetical protein
MNVGATSTLSHSWLLLIHQLPAKPAYLRVKIWRRLQALGAVAVKNAVHALPMKEETQEDFEWLLREIVEGGGEAVVCEARLIDGLSDAMPASPAPKHPGANCLGDYLDQRPFWVNSLGRFELGAVDRQFPDPLARRREDRVGDRRHHRRRTRLTNAPRSLRALD